MFENIFNTVVDVKGKTKDNIKARLDIALYCNRKTIELVYDESLPTDCANSKGLCIKCIFDRVILSTELPTDHEKYGGSLKILVRSSKITDGFLTLHRWNKLK